jgi:glutamate-5-semialdehyde dehydrogenase
MHSSATNARNAALLSVKTSLASHRDDILAANARDVARETRRGTCSAALMKRLVLGGAKFDALLAGIDGVLALPDPLRRVSMARRLDAGLDLYRVSCPIGVLCVIFEARPDAAVQIAALAIKSANAVILKGGSEAVESNAALVAAIQEGLRAGGELPVESVQLVATRQDVHALLALDEYIDLVIPRGSNALVKNIKASTKIPVMGHADGICSVYVDADADLEKAVPLVVDAKTNYPAACNSTETLLVHADVADEVLPRIAAALARAGVTKMHADEMCLPLLRAGLEGSAAGAGAGAGAAVVVAATEEDWRTEWLSLEISVKCVANMREAVAHINKFGSGHTDAILTESNETAEFFMRAVDSAGVYHNASTRFADGFRYGFGAEVGVSTNRIHARGPVGLEGLTTYKYRLYGNGQGAGDYGSAADGKRAYLHSDLPATLPTNQKA